MDIDRGFVAALIKDGSARVYFESGVDASLLKGAGRIALDFVEKYHKKNLKFPSEEIVKEFTGVTFDGVETEPIEFWASEIKNRALYGIVQRGMSDIVSAMDGKHPDEALELAERMISNARSTKLGKTKVVSLFDLAERVIEDYYKRKRGERGIITPWPKLDEQTLGWQPEDFIVFVSRSKVGKTLILMILAKHAWLENKKVMFVSTEMSHLALARRFYALHYNIPYSALRAGDLGFDEEVYLEKIRSTEKREGIFLFGEEFELSLPYLKGAIEEIKPDLLVVDGAYLLRVPNISDRFERAPVIADELKLVAKRYKIPVIASMQFSRRAVSAKADEIEDSMISLSDSFSWNCISGENYIRFAEGVKRIDEIYKGDVTPVKVFDGRGDREAVVVATGVKRRMDVVFEDGRVIKVSADHRVKVFDGIDGFSFKKAADLCGNDLCLVDGTSGIGVPIKTCYEPDYRNYNAKKIKIPEYVDSDLAFLMGVIVGDGCIQIYTWRGIVNVSVCQHDKDLLAEIERICAKFGLAPKVSLKGINKWVTCDLVNIYSKFFIEFLHSLGLYKAIARNKCIPVSIRGATEDIKISFLRGLFEADGSVAKQGYIKYNTMSYHLAIGIKLLLESLGIGSVIRVGGMNSPHGDGYKLRLSRVDSEQFIKKIGFFSERKRKMVLARMSNKREMVSKYNDFIGGKFNLLRIMKVVDSGVDEQMYDVVMVQEPHQFVCNGILVHNCDCMFALIRDQKMKEDKEMKIKTLLLREGEPTDFVIHWDFSTMTFSQKHADQSDSHEDTIPF